MPSILLDATRDAPIPSAADSTMQFHSAKMLVDLFGLFGEKIL
jgi:hypothetical protein